MHKLYFYTIGMPSKFKLSLNLPYLFWQHAVPPRHLSVQAEIKFAHFVRVLSVSNVRYLTTEVMLNATCKGCT